MVSPRRALFSVSDKEGLVEFARGLHALGFELIGTEGTAKTLKEAGLPMMTVADYTGLREGLGGRVKTLHPKIFAGILAPRGDEKDLADLGAVPIDIVVVNLYPFESTVAKPDVRLEDAIENIDIGGVSLIRAAAKNVARVSVVVRPSRYGEVLRALQEHRSIPEKLRSDLAMEAFEYTSRYDAAIFNYLAKRQGSALPPALRLAYDKVTDLRYGENPYQRAALYREPFPFAATATAEKLQGKELSYNNLIDLDAALRVATEFERPTPRPEAFKVVTKVSPTPAQLRDILFGILVSRYVKSNSIVLVQGERTVGIGAGQMSRVDACMLACLKAKGAARGSVAVSDAYFPFRDGLDELAKGGVAMVAQPGGSIRDDEVIAAADEHGIGMAFAGFRRLVSAAFIRACPNRIINIHPSLLPAFPGAHAHRDAIAAGVKVSGCTIHFVDASVDGGPIILQKAVPVLEDDTEDSLAARILEQEHILLPLAVRLFAEGRLRVEGRRVRIDTRGIKIPPMA